MAAGSAAVPPTPVHEITTFQLEITESNRRDVESTIQEWKETYNQHIVKGDDSTRKFLDASKAISKIKAKMSFMADGEDLHEHHFIYITAKILNPFAEESDHRYDLRSIALVERVATAFLIHAIVSHPDKSGILDCDRTEKYEGDLLDLIASDAQKEARDVASKAHLSSADYLLSSEVLFFESAGFETVKEKPRKGEYTMYLDTRFYEEGSISHSVSPASMDSYS